VASLCQASKQLLFGSFTTPLKGYPLYDRPGRVNYLWRGMGGTLARGLSTPMKGRGQLSPVRQESGPAYFPVRESSLAVHCTYTIQPNWFPAVRFYSV
jgi:hypothetical protein